MCETGYSGLSWVLSEVNKPYEVPRVCVLYTVNPQMFAMFHCFKYHLHISLANKCISETIILKTSGNSTLCIFCFPLTNAIINTYTISIPCWSSSSLYHLRLFSLLLLQGNNYHAKVISVSSFPLRWPCFGIFIVWVIPLGSATQQVKEDKIPPRGLWFWECERLVFMRSAPWPGLPLGAAVLVVVLFLVLTS